MAAENMKPGWTSCWALLVPDFDVEKLSDLIALHDFNLNWGTLRHDRTMAGLLACNTSTGAWRAVSG